MTDHLIPLPANFRYLNQFAPSVYAPNPSKMRCVADVEAMAAQIAYPGRFIPEELEHDLYVKQAGPDVPSDGRGISKEAVVAWFESVGIGFIDMAHLIGGDQEALRLEVSAQNEQGVAQLLTVADESQLRHAITGVKLHAWADAGMGHCILRVGYSDDGGYGLYYEPAAPGFAQPVPISWHGSIVPAGIVTCLAIMPHGVPEPPAGFSYQSGVWPAPVKPTPVFDTTKVKSTLAGMIQAQDAIKAAMVNLENDIEAFEQEVGQST